MLTRKQCRQEDDVLEVLEQSKLQQKLATICALSAETLAAISCLTKEEVEDVLDLPDLQEQLSVVQEFSSKALASLSSLVKDEVPKSPPIKEKSNLVIEKQVKQPMKQVKPSAKQENKLATEEQVKRQEINRTVEKHVKDKGESDLAIEKQPVIQESNPAIQKTTDVKTSSGASVKKVTKKGRKPGSKNKRKIEDLTWDEYEFNSDDECNAVAMTFEQMAELHENISHLPALAIPKLLEIMKSRDPEEIGENGENLEIDVETLKPVTLHEIKAFTDFYSDHSNKFWSVSTAQPRVAKAPEGNEQISPPPENFPNVPSQSSATLPPPKKKESGAVSPKKGSAALPKSDDALLPRKGLKQDAPPAKKRRPLPSECNATLPPPKKNVSVDEDQKSIVDKERILQGKLSEIATAQVIPLSPSPNDTSNARIISSKPAAAAVKPKRAKMINLPSSNSVKKAKVEEPLAAALKYPPPDQGIITMLREEEKERRRLESLSNPSFTEQIELMEWMEAQK